MPWALRVLRNYGLCLFEVAVSDSVTLAVYGGTMVHSQFVQSGTNEPIA